MGAMYHVTHVALLGLNGFERRFLPKSVIQSILDHDLSGKSETANFYY